MKRGEVEVNTYNNYIFRVLSESVALNQSIGRKKNKSVGEKKEICLKLGVL